MLPVKKLIQVTVLAMVIVSGILLGLSLGDYQLTTIAVAGAVAGFLLVDQLKLFKVDGVIANIASIIILILAMKDFFPEDSTGKLVSVANLLVYLQTVLMFQEKTPRLVWQILVLSLLHVVVAAIFSLDFEGGMLFLFYFFIASIALLLQGVYTGNAETVRRNQFSILRLGRLKPQLALQGALAQGRLSERRMDDPRQPITFFDAEQRNHRPLQFMFAHLVLWMAITFSFALILFYMIPRHAKPWFGPAKLDVASTGFNKSVDLYHDSLLLQSDELIFRVTLEGYGPDAKTEKIRVGGVPYFRGMALPDLIIEDGRTNWRAPLDRLHDGVYQRPLPFSGAGKPIKQLVTLEETAEPLVYSAMPFFRAKDTTSDIEYCHEVSALVRCHLLERIDMAPFHYILGTVLTERGGFPNSWPYASNHEKYRQYPMSKDRPQELWLTKMERSRYPGLVEIADGIARRVQADNPEASRVDLIRALENYFLEPGRFNYTMDFTDVPWTDGLDPVEDFVCNHRTGHCELYASALTLMLRSQGIPARLVVGFYAAEFNTLNQSYMVRGRHAHAWVEAYLRPEDCSQQMIDDGAAGAGGAWLRADATPPTDLQESAVGADAMDLARSMWQDYVLGMDATGSTNNENAAMVLPLFELLQSMDAENWETNLARMKNDRSVRVGVAIAVIAPFLIPWILSLFTNRSNKKREEKQKQSAIRRLFAGAISLISPSLGQWVMTGYHRSPTAFYERMLKLFEPTGLHRKPSQTHREFAREISHAFDEHPDSTIIEKTVRDVTELFNQVRFGHRNLPQDVLANVEVSLDELEQRLGRSAPAG